MNKKSLPEVLFNNIKLITTNGHQGEHSDGAEDGQEARVAGNHPWLRVENLNHETTNAQTKNGSNQTGQTFVRKRKIIETLRNIKDHKTQELSRHR